MGTHKNFNFKGPVSLGKHGDHCETYALELRDCRYHWLLNWSKRQAPALRVAGIRLNTLTVLSDCGSILLLFGAPQNIGLYQRAQVRVRSPRLFHRTHPDMRTSYVCMFPSIEDEIIKRFPVLALLSSRCGYLHHTW